MYRFVVHSNLLTLFLELRDIYSDLNTPNTELVLDNILNLIENNLGINKKSILLNIPSFDYTPFQNLTCSIKENKTLFALARKIQKDIPDTKYDIFWDPVFKIISYPGAGNSFNIKKDLYFPFFKGSTLLDNNSFLVFTEDAFQLSNIMQIEIEFFKDHHPYRKKKIFNFYNSELNKQIKYYYWVRPRNDLANYDLEKLKNLLINKKIASKLSPTNIYFIRFENLKKFISQELKNDRLFLLTNRCKNFIIRNFKEKSVTDDLYI